MALQMADSSSSPRGTVERLLAAMNAHDVDAFVDCFDADYVSEQPTHPDRAFTGAQQVRTNWTSIFAAIPDFKAELRGLCETSETVWSEWIWTGTNQDGSPFDWRGVMILGVHSGRIRSARLYMEPTDIAGAGIDATVSEMGKGGAGG
jgi:ketosteroid isomerase-like protein